VKLGDWIVTFEVRSDLKLIEPLLVLLPVIVNAEELFEHGYRYGSAWFFDAEARWDKSKTDKGLRGPLYRQRGEPLRTDCLRVCGFARLLLIQHHSKLY
jgi:hypothetical protein